MIGLHWSLVRVCRFLGMVCQNETTMFCASGLPHPDLYFSISSIQRLAKHKYITPSSYYRVNVAGRHRSPISIYMFLLRTQRPCGAPQGRNSNSRARLKGCTQTNFYLSDLFCPAQTSATTFFFLLI